MCSCYVFVKVFHTDRGEIYSTCYAAKVSNEVHFVTACRPLTTILAEKELFAIQFWEWIRLLVLKTKKQKFPFLFWTQSLVNFALI